MNARRASRHEGEMLWRHLAHLTVNAARQRADDAVAAT
jgi:hypothetical protein